MFIDYINDVEHCWKVCFSVPDVMSLWQAGDSAENNVTFVIELNWAKDELLFWKYEWGLTRAIKHDNIMPLLNDGFPKAFGQEEINKHAIIDQGWNHLHQKLMEHPSIRVDWNTDDTYSPQALLPSLNFENAEGIETSVLDQIIRE